MSRRYQLADRYVEHALRDSLDNDFPVITSTDTVLGFLARCSLKSFEALNQLKGRFEKPYLILVKNSSVAKSLINEKAHSRFEIVAKKLWPGPVTLIFAAHESVPFYMKSTKGHIAMRVPAYQPLALLLDHYETLFSTSANKAGAAVPHTENELDKEFVADVLIVLDEMHGRSQGESMPSTILDCTTDTIVLIREGSLSKTEIEGLIQMPVTY